MNLNKKLCNILDTDEGYDNQELANKIEKLFDQELIKEKHKASGWIKISTSLPPYGQNVIFRAVIKYRTEDNVVIFNDQITTDQEGLDYGMTAYLLKDKIDFIVCDHKDVGDLYDEFVTHWMPIPENGI